LYSCPLDVTTFAMLGTPGGSFLSPERHRRRRAGDNIADPDGCASRPARPPQHGWSALSPREAIPPHVSRRLGLRTARGHAGINNRPVPPAHSARSTPLSPLFWQSPHPEPVRSYAAHSHINSYVAALTLPRVRERPESGTQRGRSGDISFRTLVSGTLRCQRANVA
jgi:hypothetical protein